MSSILEELKLDKSNTDKEKTIKNKGTGAGGANTNSNGLEFEKNTDLDDKLTVIKKNKVSKTIKFNGNGKLFIKSEKARFLKYMENKKTRI